MGAQHSKKKRRHQSNGAKTGTTTSSGGSSNLARAAKAKSQHHNPYYGRDVTHERVEVVPVSKLPPPPPPTTATSAFGKRRPLKTTKELSRSAIVLPTFQDETSVLADLDFMLDSEINLDKITSTPSTRPNPKDYRRGQNRRAKHISRSSSDLNQATRPVNISRSSSNVEKREPISPLGRIPETDYPRLIPRARSANPLYSADQAKPKAKVWTKVAYRTNGTTFERDLNHKLKIGLDNDFIGYHLQRSGQQQMYRSNESIEDKLRRYRSHNELDDLEREMRRRNDVLQDAYGLPSNNGYIGYEAISRHRPRKSKNITFKEIETNRAKNVEGTAYRQHNGNHFLRKDVFVARF